MFNGLSGRQSVNIFDDVNGPTA